MLFGLSRNFDNRRPVSRRSVSVTVQPLPSSFSTAATAFSRIVAAAQYSVSSPFVAWTTYTPPTRTLPMLPDHFPLGDAITLRHIWEYGGCHCYETTLT